MTTPSTVVQSFLTSILFHSIFLKGSATTSTSRYNGSIFYNKTMDTGKFKNIVGGYECNIADHAYFVQLRTQNRHICGGSLLNEQWILTAAHCFYLEIPIIKYFVISGMDKVNVIDKRSSQVSKISKIVTHPKYFSDTNQRHDVGLGQLSMRMTKTDHTQYVQLPPVVEKLDALCKTGLSMGFGEQNARMVLHNGIEVVVKRKKTDHLKCLNFTIPPVDECYRYSARIRFPSSFCAIANYGAEDACQGDSGGPFMCGVVQVGIISGGTGCGMLGFAGVYTRVQQYVPFINSILMEEEDRSADIDNYQCTCIANDVLLLLSLIIIYYR